MLLHLTVTGSAGTRPGTPICTGDGAHCGEPGGRWSVDVAVEAAAGTPLALVEERLRALTPPWTHAPRVAGTALRADSPLGRRPLLQGAVIDVGPDPGGPDAGAGAAGRRLSVAAGPDAGRAVDLGPGEHAVGRGPVAVPVADPGLSRQHVRLLVPQGAGPVRASDLGSTNGSWLEEDGRRTAVPVHALLPSPDRRLVVGGTTLVLDPVPQPPAAHREDGAGHVEVNRAPRLRPASAHRRLRLPEPPAPAHRSPVPWLAVAVPLVLAVVMALVWSPLSLLLGLASPVLLLGQWWADRRSGRRGAAAAAAGHAQQRRDVLTALQRALAAEHAERHEAAPDPATVLETALGPGARLWERAAGAGDALELRVGTGDLPAAGCALEGDPEASLLRGVPVTVRLGDVGVLGLTGSRDARLRSARSLLAQVATWHSPAEVALVVLTTAEGARDWGWAAWLPHARAPLTPGSGSPSGARTCAVDADAGRTAAVLAELRALLEARRAPGPGAAAPGAGVPVPRAVVVLDDAERLRAVPGVADLLREGPAAGVVLLCLDAGAHRLPAECRAVLELPGADAGDLGTTGARLRVDGADPVEVRMDGLGEDRAEACARALAPLRDASAGPGAGAVPPQVRLVELLAADPDLAVDCHDAASVAALWRRAPATTRLPLGEDGTGPVCVDLAADGPHVLVAGTTGSGKSELLQSLVAALAVAHRPEELQLVLVDYKGGSAFAGCASLPHCAGLVTDLDENLTRRALRSLTAEVRRRERLLRAAGAADLDALRRTARQARATGRPAPPPPRLVLVVDEFRVLAEELPEFVDGLVRIAAVGRSLGVHLVLATQRPAGVVSADIRANTNLRLSLRVQDRADAEDVVGTAAPAHLDARLPGRAVLRRGGEAPATFQTARIGGPAPGPRPPVQVRPVRSGAVREVPEPRGARDLPGPAAPSDLDLLVAAVRGAAERTGAAPPAPPWLPPLPGSHLAPPVAAAPHEGPDRPRLPWGLLDLPDEQRQEAAVWDLTAGQHLAVVGTVRSGRSTLVRTLVQAAGAHTADAHCYVLDGGGALGGLAALAHVGAVVGPEEVWRAGRVLAALLAAVGTRREDLARAGFASLEEQHAAVPADERLPYLLLLVDGWDSWSRILADAEEGVGVDAVLRLLREGSAAGVRVAVTGDRALLTSAAASAAGTLVLLRLADRADAALAGVAPRQLPLEVVPGRGVRVVDGRADEVQLSLPRQEGAAAPPRRPPRRVQPLPAVCPVGDLPGAEEPVADLPDLPPLLLGWGGDGAGPVHLDLGPCTLVAGPAGSGRTSALAVLAAAAAAVRWPVALVGARPPQPATFPGALGHWSPGSAAALATALDAAAAAGRPALVLVDDVAELVDADVEDLLLHRLAAHRGERVVGAGDGEDLAAAYRGLAVPLRRPGRGLLLARGTRVAGAVLGLRTQPAPGRGPGVGLLVRPELPGAARTAAVRLLRPPVGVGGAGRSVSP